ncbi:hypothetical protein RR46_08885 [Papilio xuthus]|uniref:Uncharacterized protein n=1 Tax=Papilio xuthus TaxID=66420 RepID=A0A194PPQ4_PAPXU|nr:hypothetical protein RR46_08885 [Papilio xuthus]
MFSKPYEKRLVQQCSPVSKKESVLVRPEVMDRFIPCRPDNNWQTSFQGRRTGSWALEREVQALPRVANRGRRHLANRLHCTDCCASTNRIFNDFIYQVCLEIFDVFS